MATTKAKNPASAPSVPEVTGYRTEESLFATRYKQGGRTVYSIALSPDQIVNLIGQPDPDKPNPGNRRIRPNHAEGFAKYFREQEDWVIPGMILRAPNIFAFNSLDQLEGVDGAEFGVLSYPKRAQGDIHILDGQHRILGFHLALKGIDEDLDKTRSQRAAARRVDPGGAAVKQADARIRELEKQRERFYSERVSVEIQVTDDAVAYKQMFFDIAENALGITASVKARFDNRKVINRALPTVLEHPLLNGRVDLEADRIGRGSPYLMGARHVAEIVRSEIVGLDGRVSRRQEEEWQNAEGEIARKGLTLFDVLMEHFAPLKAVALGQILPDDLRKTSLLGSVLMLRILAAVHYELTRNHAFSEKMVGEFFDKLSPHMAGRAHADSIWMRHAPDGSFHEGSMAPNARRQEAKALRDFLTDAAITDPSFLSAPPQAEPKQQTDEEETPEVENEEAWALLSKTEADIAERGQKRAEKREAVKK